MELNNVYDFDKTILKKDGIVMFYLYLLKRKLWLFWHIFVVAFVACLYYLKLIKVETFKEYLLWPLKFFKDRKKVLEQFAQKAKRWCNNYYLNQMKDDDVICTASPVFLAKAIMEVINPSATIIGSNVSLDTLKFDKGAQNCKGYHKIECLKEYYKSDNISCHNAYSDSLDDIYLFDMAEKAYMIIGNKPVLYKQNNEIQKIPFNFKLKFKYTLKMMRPKHYIKNLLIFFPLFLLGQMFIWDKLLLTIMGFFVFCLMSSFVYCVNDLCDIKNDRKHSTKRLRAIASGMITSKEALFICGFLLIISSVICALCLNWFASIIVIGYVLLNITYSLKLKNIPILDLIVLALCYVIRLGFGASIINVMSSVWIVLTVFSMAMFIGIIKRRNEILTEIQKTRSVSKFYSPQWLYVFELIFAVLTCIFYALFILFNILNLEFGWNSCVLAVSAWCVACILKRYVYITNKHGNSGNPMEVLFKDFCLILFVFAFLCLLVLGLYVTMPVLSYCIWLFIGVSVLAFIYICVPTLVYTKIFTSIKNFFKKHEKVAEIFRFLIIGGTATIIDFFVTGLSEYLIEPTKFANIWEVFLNSQALNISTVIVGNTIGFIVGLMFNYIFSIIFVYKESGYSKSIKGFVIFSILSLVGLAINLLGVYILFGVIQINQWLSKVIMTFIVLVYNYVSRKYLIFNKKF